jgi:Tol biopolymer transport system component
MLRIGLTLLASSALFSAAHAGAVQSAPSHGVSFVGQPVLVAPNIISSEFSEVRATISPDGQWMLWGSTNRPGGPGGWNIWISRQSARGWSAPESASFNSDANDFDPAFAPDGRSLYFFSNREGGFGGDDLYRISFVGGKFGAVEHLGAEVNSAGDEWAPALSLDGKTLLFSTNGRGGAGRHDLFVSQATGAGLWGNASSVTGAINTAADEFDATFLSDGKTIVFTRSPDVAADEPVTLHVASLGASGYEVGAPLAFTTDFQYSLGPALNWRDRSLLLFSAAAKDAKSPRADVYEVRYKLR